MDAAIQVYPDWPWHASRLVEGLRGLSPAQLDLRAAPEHAPIWALACHVAGTRVYWLCTVFGEPGVERARFIDSSTGEGWEDDLAHPRSATEVVEALEVSWAIVEAALARWTIPTLDETFERAYGGRVQRHTRASVLNRLFTHDAFHAGEISQLLGARGFTAIDLWRRSPASG